ncbi:MAG TPA: hypothetical protein VGL93_17215 [Streptosporangiaceae bacterium]|jgi:hypothetical protein
MTEQQFPDPLNEALARTGERGIQLTSLLLYGAQLGARWNTALRERQAGRRAQRLRELELERQRTRLTWAPALDREWLAHADLLQVARIWGVAMPYAERETRQYDSTAESAMRNCEDRLRTLHPHAMARYDRLRRDGWTPESAMREAVPLFDRPPNVHEAGPASRPLGALRQAAPRTIPERGATFDLFPHGPSKAEFLAVRRAQRITERLTASTHGDGHTPLGRGEIRTVLEAMTNLSPETIDQVTGSVPETPRAGDVGLARSMAQRATGAERTRAADLNAAIDDPTTGVVDERTDELRDTARQGAAAAAYRTIRVDSAVDIAARDFPFTARHVVIAADHARSSGTASTTTPPIHRVHHGRR